MSFPAPDRQVFTPGPASGDDVKVHRMYYTFCGVCGAALSDWSDSMAEARRNRRAHLEKHKRSVAAGPGR
jgi:adenine-specific DNA methylase